MKKITILFILLISTVSHAQINKTFISFDQLFPPTKQKQMGLHKLTDKEKEALRSHVEILLKLALSEASSKESSSKLYSGVGEGHWISKNIENGAYILLEDGTLWQIDPLDKIDAMLWLPISNITVIESSSGSPGYNYLLINTDDGEKAHAKYIGKK